MKRLGIMAALVLLCSCSMQAPTPHQVRERKRVVLFTDYAKYNEQGVLITPYQYMGEYKSIGEIQIIIQPGSAYQKIQDDRNPQWYTIEYKEDNVSVEEIIEDIVVEAQKKGADAITNFKIEMKDYPGPTTYYASGFCIKRL